MLDNMQCPNFHCECPNWWVSLIVASGRMETRLSRAHIPDMTSGTQTTVIFSCPKCGLGYRATQEQHSDKQTGSFKCGVCKAEVHAWSGAYDFFGWKPITMNPPRPWGTKI